MRHLEQSGMLALQLTSFVLQQSADLPGQIPRVPNSMWPLLSRSAENSSSNVVEQLKSCWRLHAMACCGLLDQVHQPKWSSALLRCHKKKYENMKK